MNQLDCPEIVASKEETFPIKRLDFNPTDPRLWPYVGHLTRINALAEDVQAKIDAFVLSSQLDEKDMRSAPSDITTRLLADAGAAQARYETAAEALRRAVGIPPEVLAALDRADLPILEERYDLRDVIAAPSTGDFDTALQTGLESLRQLVDHRWLDGEAQKRFRLDQDFRTNPLHIFPGGHTAGSPEVAPQRFAQMLLVAADHLAKRSDLDFLSAPMLLGEVAALGNRLKEVTELGRHAVGKLRNLPQLSDDEVASVIYELLVGTACVRMGLQTEMLPTGGDTKSPDFNISNLGIPLSIECKRRLGPLDYELAEADHVQHLFESVRPSLALNHPCIEVTFLREVREVTVSAFASAVLPLLEISSEVRQATLDWGRVTVTTLPYVSDIEMTRVYSPDYLMHAFHWTPYATDFDGISCEVEPPTSPLVERIKNPRCMKWSSRSETALVKKSRGVTSLWGRATQQIPAGRLGFVYIAYSEGHSAQFADARTRHIRETSKKWFHRWQIRIGGALINRLYPRATGCGMPDLTESTLPILDNGDESWLGIIPTLVFTPHQTKLV